MKKTIIMLLAMSGIASAALEQIASMDDLLAGATLGTGVTNTSSEYTNSTVLNFVADHSAVIGITNSGLADIINAKTGYLTIAAWINPTAVSESSIFGWGGQSDGVKVAIKGGKAQETTKGLFDHTLSGCDSITTGDWQLVAFSIALNGSNTSRYLTGDDAGRYWSGQDWGTWNGTASTFAIGSARSNEVSDRFLGDIANLTLYYSTEAATKGDLQAAGITNLKPIAVPEPATATLSLLALAGLCARRRRH